MSLKGNVIQRSVIRYERSRGSPEFSSREGQGETVSQSKICKPGMQSVCVIKASRVLRRIGPDLIGLDRIRSDQTLYRGTSCALVRIGSNQTLVPCTTALDKQ